MRVLGAFVDAGGIELSGADISQRIGMLSGTLYPILIRFREAGWLTDRLEDGEPSQLGRPRKRFYRLTRIGRCALERGQIKISAGEIV
jgi:DNA-binding PadR family transcriptional regulator